MFSFNFFYPAKWQGVDHLMVDPSEFFVFFARDPADPQGLVKKQLKCDIYNLYICVSCKFVRISSC